MLCCQASRNSSNKANVCNRHMVCSSNISSWFDHVSDPSHNFSKLIVFVLSWCFFSKHLWIHDISNCLVKSSHVKIKSLVNNSTGSYIFGIQFVIFSILVDEVGSCCTTFVHTKIAIFQSRNCMLRIHLKVLRSSILSVHQIQLISLYSTPKAVQVIYKIRQGAE